MSEKWTKQDAINYLQEVVDERGEDYVYTKPEESGGFCVNSTLNGESSCIVGVVLKNHVPETFELVHQYEWESYQEDEDGDVIGVCEMSVDSVPGIEDIVDGEAFQVLALAQREQDMGMSYGKVMEAVRNL